jgi:hypothetical protein
VELAVPILLHLAKHNLRLVDGVSRINRERRISRPRREVGARPKCTQSWRAGFSSTIFARGGSDGPAIPAVPVAATVFLGRFLDGPGPLG